MCMSVSIVPSPGRIRPSGCIDTGGDCLLLAFSVAFATFCGRIAVPAINSREEAGRISYLPVKIIGRDVQPVTDVRSTVSLTRRSGFAASLATQ